MRAVPHLPITTPSNIHTDLFGRLLHGFVDLVIQRPIPPNLTIKPCAKINRFGKPVCTWDVARVHSSTSASVYKLTLTLNGSHAFKNRKVNTRQTDGLFNYFNQIRVNAFESCD